MEPTERQSISLPPDIRQDYQVTLKSLEEELSATALEYKVVHTKAVTMRAEPNVYSTEVGRLSPGDVVKGFPTGPWIFVKECNGPLPQEGAWVLADGTPLGVGNLLVPEWSRVTHENTSDGIRFEWPGLGAKDRIYYFQWFPKDGNEFRDGATVIAMQKKGQAAVTIVPGIPLESQVHVRVIAALDSGLLVGAWNTVMIESDRAASSKSKPEKIPADVLRKAAEKYTTLAEQLQAARKTELGLHSAEENMRHCYADRPKDGEAAKELVLNTIFGNKSVEKKLGEAEGAVEDMFGSATAGYEEGIAGECNRMLAEVIGTLIRKHG